MERQLPVLLSAVITSRDTASTASSSQSLLHSISFRHWSTKWSTRRIWNWTSYLSSSKSTIISELHGVVLRTTSSLTTELVYKNFWIVINAAARQRVLKRTSSDFWSVKPPASSLARSKLTLHSFLRSIFSTTAL